MIINECKPTGNVRVTQYDANSFIIEREYTQQTKRNIFSPTVYTKTWLRESIKVFSSLDAAKLQLIYPKYYYLNTGKDEEYCCLDGCDKCEY
jgi:hypothetical protein